MAEKITIQSFKFGVDTRREQLVYQPGTLVDLVNGHINQGGEIEKRKAFVLFSDTGIFDSNGDAGVFGIESTDTGLMRFGSAIVNGGAVTQGQPTLASAFPATNPILIYQQLQHPAVIDGSNYDRTIHRMTAVPSSTTFKGKAFVIAKFADGKTFMYYNGSLIQQSRNGIVLTGRTSLANLGTELAREINAISSWKAVANADTYTGETAASVAITGSGTGATFTATVSGGVVSSVVIGSGGTGYAVGDLLLVRNSTGSGYVVKVLTLSTTAVATVSIVYGGYGSQNGLDTVLSPVGVTFSPNASESSAAGIQGSLEVDQARPAFAAIGAKTFFTFSAGSSGGITSITGPAKSDGTGSVTLCGVVNYTTSLSNTAALTVAAINANTLFTGYSATNSGATVTVYAPTTWGNVTFSLTITYTGVTVDGSGAVGSSLTVTVSPGTTEKVRLGTGTATVSQLETATGSGGTGPYTYTWTETSGTSGISFASTGSSVSFSKSLARATSVTGYFRCEVTDTGAANAKAHFDFTLTLSNETSS
jgi:hypothetical protein